MTLWDGFRGNFAGCRAVRRTRTTSQNPENKFSPNYFQRNLPRDVKHAGTGNDNHRVASVVATGAQAAVQRLGRVAIDAVNDGRGRARMVMPVMLRREQECMVLRLISGHRSSTAAGTTVGCRRRCLQMVMVVVQCGRRVVMWHQR